MEKMEKEDVILFPFMAQGHIIPFLALAKCIEQKGHNIIFVNTPLIIRKIQNSLPPDSSSSISLIEIPFDSTEHGLPPDSEISDVIPFDLGFRLLRATSSLEAPFRKLLGDLVARGKRPLCVIADFFFGWTAHVVHDFGVFHAIFSGTGGFGMGCYYSAWMNLPLENTQSDEFALPDFPEAGKFHVTQLSPALAVAKGNDNITSFQQKNLSSWSNSDALLLNTVSEIDNLGLTYFRRKLGIPVWAIGPILLPEQDRAKTGREATISTEQCIEWLDAKEPNSVLYISFGSQNTISASQMMQLAKALDASGRNFIWVVRPPLGFDISAEFIIEDWLPEGFPRRIEDQKRGLIVNKWAPQLEILSHKSVAAFLSHCGWNSVLESLQNGVPLISWPMAAEQFFNAKFLVEEIGVCVELARGTNFEVRQEDIMERIELVMGENEKAEGFRRRVWEIKGIIRDACREEEDYKGSSVKAIEEFFVSSLLRKKKNQIDKFETQCTDND